MRAVLRFLQWFVFLVVAFIVVTFVVQNREVVDVRLWPLPYVIPAPLFGVMIASVLLGFVVGAFSAWLSGGGARKRAREMARQNAEKAQQISHLRQQLEAQRQAAPHSRPPAITHAA